jgi:trehalose 6-phosphate phosphatase
MRSSTVTVSDGGRAPPRDLLLGSSLFLDFDGTLVEIADRPHAVEVTARLRDLLSTLGEKLAGRIALITGRGAEQIQELLGSSAVSVVGSHGLEFRLADGRRFMPPPPAELEQVRREMNRLAQEWENVLVEEKPLGAALHYRLAPAAEGACVALARDLAERHGLHLQTGKMLVELRCGTGDKGTAVRRLMEEPEMQGTRPVFIGDDDTDEPAFVAAQDLGGAGILVGTPRRTAARYRLEGPAAVLGWLEQAVAA